MKNTPHFGEGFELFFGFQKTGVGGCFVRKVRKKRLIYLSSAAMHSTVPVPQLAGVHAPQMARAASAPAGLCLMR